MMASHEHIKRLFICGYLKHIQKVTGATCSEAAHAGRTTYVHEWQSFKIDKRNERAVNVLFS